MNLSIGTPSCTVVGESSSLALNRQVGDGGAQRLLRLGGYVGAVDEVKAGECLPQVKVVGLKALTLLHRSDCCSVTDDGMRQWAPV
jgi:hypothetical protein